VEPLVMASEISGLGQLRGFLKLGNLVVRLNVPFSDLPKRHPAFVERAPAKEHTAEGDRSIGHLQLGMKNSTSSRNSSDSRNSSQVEARNSRDSTEARHSRGTGARAESDGEPAVVRDDGKRRVPARQGHRAPGLFGDE
jgi:hypothetical protein